MLQALRQFRRRLAGTLGVLVAGTWLALALAPCAAMADVQMQMDEHCPHCDHAATPCADAMPECELPPALAAAEGERFEPLKLLALPASHAFPAPSGQLAPPGPLPRTVDPPSPDFSKIYCRYQE